MIIDLDILFPEELSDEAFAAIVELLSELVMQRESQSFHRIRGNQARWQTDLLDPDQPWQSKTDD